MKSKSSMFRMIYIPISRSCHGWAATDLLDKDERILSLRRGAGRCSLWLSLVSSLICQNQNVSSLIDIDWI